MPEATCIICGCTESHACEGGCSWLAIQRDHHSGVCSSCVPPELFGPPSWKKRQLARERCATLLLRRWLDAVGATP